MRTGCHSTPRPSTGLNAIEPRRHEGKKSERPFPSLCPSSCPSCLRGLSPLPDLCGDNPFHPRVDVEAVAAEETDEGDVERGGEGDGEAARGGDGADDGDARRERLLHDL